MTGNDQFGRIWRKLSNINRSTIPEFPWLTKGQYSGRTPTGHLLHCCHYKWTRCFCCKDVQTYWHLDNSSFPFVLPGQCALNPHDWSLQGSHGMWRRRQAMLAVKTRVTWKHSYKHTYIHTYTYIIHTYIPISIDIHAHTHTHTYIYIYNTQHAYGPPEQTLHMLKTCHKRNLMNMWENCMQQLNHLQILIDEQPPQELNPLYTLGYNPRQLATLDGS
jgi:hypothetical protein